MSDMWSPPNYLFDLTASFNVYGVTWLVNGGQKIFCDCYVMYFKLKIIQL